MSEQIRQQRRRWPDEVLIAAQQLAQQPGATNRSIAAGLALQFDHAPIESTIANWVREKRLLAADDLWTVGLAEPEEARLVLPILAGVIEHTQGRIRHVTIAEARWIAKLRHLSGELMPAWQCYQFASAYVFMQERTLDTTALDHRLAFADWRTWPMANPRYARATTEWGVEWFGLVEGAVPAVTISTDVPPIPNESKEVRDAQT